MGLSTNLLPSGPSRCYPFWQEVLGCYVVNSGEGEAGKKKCTPALEDYHECLHHRKEVRHHPTPISTTQQVMLTTQFAIPRLSAP